MGEMDPAIPLSPDFDLRNWLEKDLLIGGWQWSEQRVVFLTISIHASTLIHRGG
jgi:hypothetical protein